MRLNAAWGLEPKPDAVENYRAGLPKGLSHGEEGVQYDTRLETNQFHDEDVGRTALDKLITLLQSRHDDDGYFLYMKSSESNDPYELIPLVEYKQEKDQAG
jgi:hypothetical protein